MSTYLSIEDLKTIRLALTTVHITKGVWDTINNVDAELAKHNLRAVYRSLPKRKYQRHSEGEYVFEQINAQ